MGRNAPHIDAEYIRSMTVENATGCLLWTGRLNTGYGIVSHMYMHRAAYELARGPIPKDFIIHHMCGNRACVNVEHLSALPEKVHLRLHNDKHAGEFRKKRLAESRELAVSA